jgi:hypothetical protein
MRDRNSDNIVMVPLAQATIVYRNTREVVLRAAQAQGRAELRGSRWYVGVPRSAVAA